MCYSGRQRAYGSQLPGLKEFLVLFLKFLFPTGVLDLKDGKLVNRGGIKWTIKDGITYNTPTLLKDVADMVSKARADLRGKK